jgi:hypothetical protein
MSTSQKNTIESMTDILGSNYQILSQRNADPIVLSKLPDEDLAAVNSVLDDNEQNPDHQINFIKRPEKTKNDYLFQVYLGSITVVGLFVLFRMIQKSR